MPLHQSTHQVLSQQSVSENSAECFIAQAAAGCQLFEQSLPPSAQCGPVNFGDHHRDPPKGSRSSQLLCDHKITHVKYDNLLYHNHTFNFEVVPVWQRFEGCSTVISVSPHTGWPFLHSGPAGVKVSDLESKCCCWGKSMHQNSCTSKRSF